MTGVKLKALKIANLKSVLINCNTKSAMALRAVGVTSYHLECPNGTYLENVTAQYNTSSGGAISLACVNDSSGVTSAAADDDDFIAQPKPLWELIVWSILAGLAILMTIGGNFVVILSFIIDRNIRVATNFFLASLACSDLLIGMISMPFYTVYLLHQSWPLGEFLCDLWLSCDYTVCLTSIYTVFCITIDRYCSIKRPSQYREWRTDNTVIFIIFLTWILPILVFFTSIFGWQYFVGERTVKHWQCHVQYMEEPLFNTILQLCYFWLTMVIMITLYVGIYKVASHMHRQAEERRMNTILAVAGHTMAGHAKAFSGITKQRTTGASGAAASKPFLTADAMTKTCSDAAVTQTTRIRGASLASCSSSRGEKEERSSSPAFPSDITDQSTSPARRRSSSSKCNVTKSKDATATAASAKTKSKGKGGGKLFQKSKPKQSINAAVAASAAAVASKANDEHDKPKAQSATSVAKLGFGVSRPGRRLIAADKTSSECGNERRQSGVKTIDKCSLNEVTCAAAATETVALLNETSAELTDNARPTTTTTMAEKLSPNTAVKHLNNSDLSLPNCAGQIGAPSTNGGCSDAAMTALLSDVGCKRDDLNMSPSSPPMTNGCDTELAQHHHHYNARGNRADYHDTSLATIATCHAALTSSPPPPAANRSLHGHASSQTRLSHSPSWQHSIDTNSSPYHLNTNAANDADANEASPVRRKSAMFASELTQQKREVLKGLQYIDPRFIESLQSKQNIVLLNDINLSNTSSSSSTGRLCCGDNDRAAVAASGGGGGGGAVAWPVTTTHSHGIAPNQCTDMASPVWKRRSVIGENGPLLHNGIADNVHQSTDTIDVVMSKSTKSDASNLGNKYSAASQHTSINQSDINKVASNASNTLSPAVQNGNSALMTAAMIQEKSNSLNRTSNSTEHQAKYGKNTHQYFVNDRTNAITAQTPPQHIDSGCGAASVEACGGDDALLATVHAPYKAEVSCDGRIITGQQTYPLVTSNQLTIQLGADASALATTAATNGKQTGQVADADIQGTVISETAARVMIGTQGRQDDIRIKNDTQVDEAAAAETSLLLLPQVDTKSQTSITGDLMPFTNEPHVNAVNEAQTVIVPNTLAESALSEERPAGVTNSLLPTTQCHRPTAAATAAADAAAAIQMTQLLSPAAAASGRKRTISTESFEPSTTSSFNSKVSENNHGEILSEEEEINQNSVRFRAGNKKHKSRKRSQKNGSTKGPIKSIIQVSKRKRTSGEKERSANQKKQVRAKRANKALRTITIILGAFVICWTPWHVLSLLMGFGVQVPDTLYSVSYWLCYMNSPINPFCYAFVNQTFKKTFLRILRLDWHRT